jgi:cytochrome b
MTSYRIWDPALRLFHWLLALGFIANAFLIDGESRLHELVGFTIMGLVGLRLIWGLVGPQAARFASFLPSRGALTAQLQDMALGRHSAHLGHSPLGALMIFNLLGTLILVGLTGYMMTTNAFWGVKWVEEAHEILATWAELSVLAHVLAVLWESRRTGINLPKAMITGRKDIPDRINLSR